MNTLQGNGQSTGRLPISKRFFLLDTVGRPLRFPSYTTHWGTPSKVYSYSVLRTEAVEQRSEFESQRLKQKGILIPPADRNAPVIGRDPDKRA